jgi:hypothetical protein
VRTAARAALSALLIGMSCAAWGGGAASGASLLVHGHRLVYAGRTVQLRGVSRSGLEYACIQGWGFFDSPQPGRVDTPAMIGAMAAWDINVVRVPLNEDCWLGVNTPRGRGGPRYRRIVEEYVRALERAHLFVMLDLHLAAPGRTRATAQLPMADADHGPAFWRSVARAFRGDGDLLFDLYNEPYGIGWSCWLRGCALPAVGSVPAYRTTGMQQLVDAVRSAGARQPLVVGGLDYANDLGGWLAHAPHDPLHALIASEHTYGGLSPCAAACRAAVVRTARRVPVVFGELGETDCRHGYVDAMMRLADAHGIGYLGWAWDATAAGGWTCRGGPSLITRYDGAPTPFGRGFRDHFRRLGMPVRPSG